MADDATTIPASTEPPPITPAPNEPPESAGKSNHLLQTDANAPDPDEAEYQAALKEVADEEGTKGDEPPADTPPAEPPASQPEPQPPANTPPPGLLDERKKRQDAEEAARKNAATAAYWQGVAEGKFPDPRRSNEPAERPQPKPGENQIKALRSDMSALADQVDKGTLSTKEYEEKRAILEDQIFEIREKRTLDTVKASQNDLYLDTVTSRIEGDNPWLANVPAEEVLDLTAGAVRDLKAAGVNYDAIAETPMGDYRLREAVVARAKRFGFDKTFGGDAPPPSNGNPPAPKGPTAVPTAKDLADKQALAAHAPPTPSGTNAPANAWTEQRVEEMSDLDLENMSKADLARLGGEMDRQATARRVSAPPRR